MWDKTAIVLLILRHNSVRTHPLSTRAHPKARTNQGVRSFLPTGPGNAQLTGQNDGYSCPLTAQLNTLNSPSTTASGKSEERVLAQRYIFLLLEGQVKARWAVCSQSPVSPFTDGCTCFVLWCGGSRMARGCGHLLPFLVIKQEEGLRRQPPRHT